MQNSFGFRKNELKETFEKSVPNGTKQAYYKPDGIAIGVYRETIPNAQHAGVALRPAHGGGDIATAGRGKE
jgi:hypothetical protein